MPILFPDRLILFFHQTAKIYNSDKSMSDLFPEAWASLVFIVLLTAGAKPEFL